MVLTPSPDGEGHNREGFPDWEGYNNAKLSQSQRKLRDASKTRKVRICPTGMYREVHD
jgi:hypothetical protein